jgi:hypothetical protein
LKTFLSVFLIAILPNSAFGADLCEDLVKDIRNRPNIVSGAVSASVGIRQNPRFLVETQTDYGSLTDAEYLKRLHRHFPAISDDPNDYGFGDSWVLSVPTAKTHAIIDDQGALHCRGFIFYREGAETNLPEPPIPIGGCDEGPKPFNSSFGTIHDVPAALTSQDDFVGFNETIWVAGLTNLSWDKGCRVDVSFGAIFQDAHTFASQDSGLVAGEWTKTAIEIAQAHGVVLENPNFHFGDALPEDLKAGAAQLLDAVKKDSLSNLPLFGKEDKRAEEFFMNGEGGMSFHTVVLNNRPYALEIGHLVGMRSHAYAPMGLILFDWKDGKAISVASALVDVKRGPLKSLAVKQSLSGELDHVQ